MITRHHVALTILCTLILCSALVPDTPLFILVICMGAGIGAILPDIQMRKPHTFKIRTLAWMVARFGSLFCTPLICRLYRRMTGLTYDTTDKRLTHSVLGIVLLWAILSAFVLVPASILMHGAALEIPYVFLGGVMLGLVLHLIEDLCTRKGITPLFPFSIAKISGSIRPCDTTDRRIAQFHFYDCSVAGIIIGFQFLGTGQALSAVPVCLFGLGSCLGMMVLSSDVEIMPEDPKDAIPAGQPVVMLDPLSFLGKPKYPDSGLMMGVYYFSKS